MQYKNASTVLPQELIEVIQEYVQGEYLYIPIKNRLQVAEPTEYVVELQKRDAHIYNQYLEGVTNKKLASMYHLSESSIRRIIINQRKRYETMRDKVNKIVEHWDISSKKITQIYDSAWQIGEEYILKVYDNADMLERNVKVITILDDMQIPVGSIVCTREKEGFAQDEQYYYVLTKRLQGSNIVSMRNYRDIARKMGQIIADLHIAFQICEQQEAFEENSLLVEMKGWVRSSLADSGWKYIAADTYDATVTQLEKQYASLPVQLIHRDVHFGNFLFREGKFSGYIDFDLSQRNIRIFDLCYFMLGLLSEKDKLDIDTEAWYDVLKNVFLGYEQKIKLSEEEKAAVPYVMESIELLFVAWFSTQEDSKCAESAMAIYEFVEKNTQKILNMI